MSYSQFITPFIMNMEGMFSPKDVYNIILSTTIQEWYGDKYEYHKGDDNQLYHMVRGVFSSMKNSGILHNPSRGVYHF